MSSKTISEPIFSEIEIMRQHWERGSAYSYIMKKRPFWGLCYINKGKIEYKCKNKCITANAGDMALIKKGSHYCSVFSDESVEDILINFSCSKSVFPCDEDIEIIKNRTDIGKSFSEIADYAMQNEHKYMIKSIFYLILDNILTHDKENGLAAQIKRTIAADTSFSLSEKEIAKNCAVSISTVQRTFKKTYKKTLAAYRSELRITAAKKLLLSGRYSIEEIAEKLNYCDSAHFSKSFKKAVGISPKKYTASVQSLPYF